MCNFVEASRLLSAYEKIISKYESLKPWIFNILEEIHANENDHTRIFVKLLQYEENDKYPFLEEFISRLNSKMKASYKISGVESPKVLNQKDYIDCCILNKCKNEAIIIENKIEGAHDRPNQLRNYFNKIQKKQNISEEKIFIVYLTADGNQIVSENSFTDDLKTKIGFINEVDTGRYIAINYRDDILPMLEEIKNKNILKNEISKAGLTQYVDYLISRFRIRECEREYYYKMKEDLLQAINISKTENIVDQFSKLENTKIKTRELLKWIEKIQSNLTNDIVEKYRKEFLEKCTPFRFVKNYESVTLEFEKWFIQASAEIDSKEYFVLDVNFFIHSIECKFFCRKAQEDSSFDSNDFFHRVPKIEEVLKRYKFKRNVNDFAYRFNFNENETYDIFDAEVRKSRLTELIVMLLKEFNEIEKTIHEIRIQ